MSVADEPALRQAAQQADWSGFWRKVLALNQAGKFKSVPEEIAMVYLRLGELEQALAWLEKSFAERGNAPFLIKTAPIFDPLRQDPRFIAMLRRAGHTR